MKFRVLFFVVLTAFFVTGCAGMNFSDPMPDDIGGKKVVKPDMDNFRGLPVVQLTFLPSQQIPSRDAEDATLGSKQLLVILAAILVRRVDDIA